ncbi:MAG TPA: ABC transporter permease [Candidatus Acidoferrales bacterium]|jgi:ABC-2 type transport system permease protein|nr:ABC transporter permease [Candidatus Acidoferrales bacterium]
MNAIAAVIYREARLRAGNVTFLFWDLCFPLLYMLIFGIGVSFGLGVPESTLGSNYSSFFLAGVLNIAGFGIASNTAWSFFMDRDNGIFYEMLTYPLSRAQYLFGKVVFNLFVVVVQAALAVSLAGVLLHVRIRVDLIPLLAIALVGGATGWFFLYATLALRIRRNDVFNSVSSVLWFLPVFMSSTFYPLAALPGWFRIIATVNPVTWQVDVLRYTSIGLGQPRQILQEAAAFAVFAVIMFFLAVRSLRSQE